MPTISTKLVIEGEAAYKQAIQNCNTQLKELKSELKLVTAQYADNANSVEALTAKNEVLNKMQEVQAKKFEETAAILESAKKAQQETADAYADARKKLEENTSALNEYDEGTRKAGETWNKYAEKLADAEARLEKIKQASGDSSEAQLAVQKSITSTQKKMQDLASSTEGAAEEVGRLINENKALTKCYSAAEKKNDQATAAVTKYQTETNSAATSLIELNAEIRENSVYLREAEKSSDGCAKSIDVYGKTVDKATEKTVQANGKIETTIKTLKIASAIIGSIGAVVGASLSAIKKVADLTVDGAAYADDVMTTSTITGLPTEQLQEFMYAAELVDVSVDTLTSTMTKQIRSMKAAQDGTKLSIEAYEKLGVQYQDASGKLRDGNEVYWEVIDALGSMENETERDAIAMQLLGKSAREINPLITAGASTMQALASAAHDAGYILSDEMLQAYGKLDDNLQYLSKNADAAKNALGQILLPVLTDLADYGGKKIAEFTTRINEANGDLEAIGAIAGEMLPEVFEHLLEYVPEIARMAVQVVAGAADAMLYNLPTIVQTVTETINQVIKEIIPVLTQRMPELVDALSVGLVDLISGVIDTLPELIEKIVATTISLMLETAPRLIIGLGELVAQLVKALPDMVKGAVIGLKDALLDALDLTVLDSKRFMREIAENAVAASEMIQKINGTYRDSITKTEEAATLAEQYIERLEELEAQGLKTQQAQDEYRKTVELINQLIPNLNLQLNEQTGLIDGSTAALKENIKAWRESAKEQILLEKRKALLEEYIELQIETKRNEHEYAAALEREKDLEEKYNAKREKFAYTNEFGVKAYSRDVAFDDDVSAAQGAWAKAQKEAEAYAKALETARTSLETYEAEMQITETAMEELIAAQADSTAQTEREIETTKEKSDVLHTTTGETEKAREVTDQLSASLSAASEKAMTASQAEEMLSAAMAEQKENGEIGLATIQKLIDAGYAAVLQIDAETGAVTMNRDAYVALVKAQINEQIVAAQADRSRAIKALTDNVDAVHDLRRGYYDAAIAAYALDAAQVGDIKAMDAQIAAMKRMRDEIGKTNTATRTAGTTKQQTQAEKNLEAYRNAKKELDHERNMDLVDEAEYYRSLLELRDRYLKDTANIDEYRSVTETLHTAEKKASEEALKAQQEIQKEKEKLYDEQLAAYKNHVQAMYEAGQEELKKIKNAYEEAVKAQQALTERLQNYGGIQISDDETAITHIKDQIDAIRAYGRAIDSLKEMGLSDEHMAEIMALGVDEATRYADQLLALSEEDREAYKALYEEKIQLAKEVSQDLYKDELEELKSEYTAMLDQVYATTGDKAYESGVQLIQGLENGMSAESEMLMERAREIADELRAAFASAIAGDAELMTPQYPAIMNEMPDMTRQQLSAATMAAVQTIGANNQKAMNVSSGTLVIPLYINGRELARATINDYRAVSDQSPRVEVRR